MKTDTDFDALLAGLSPEETRRLQKILAEWGHGDENGFPVQLALLTKAQWRTAAAVPKLVETERKLLADLLGHSRVDAQTTARSVQEAMRTQMLSLQSEVTRQSTAVQAAAAATIRIRLTEAEALTTEIKRTLQDGKKAWEEARIRFIDEGNSLAHSVVEARGHLDASRGLNRLLSLGLALLVGIAIGAGFTYRLVARLPVVQLAPAPVR